MDQFQFFTKVTPGFNRKIQYIDTHEEIHEVLKQDISSLPRVTSESQMDDITEKQHIVDSGGRYLDLHDDIIKRLANDADCVGFRYSSENGRKYIQILYNSIGNISEFGKEGYYCLYVHIKRYNESHTEKIQI